MVKSEPMDDVPQEPVAAPPAKRPRGRPRKDGTVSGQGKTAATDVAGSSAGRGKGGGHSSSKKTGIASGGVGRGKILLHLHDSSNEKEATPVLPPPGFDPIPKYAAAAAAGKTSTEVSSASTDSLENPWSPGWDVFPIEEFLLILHPPVAWPVQRLPDAFTDALPGVGHFLFKLFREGATQGPWDVTVRSTSRVVVNDIVNKVEFIKGWDEFADFYELEAGFVLCFRLRRDLGIFYVKVFDGTLCLKPWLGKKKTGAAGKLKGVA